MQFLTTTAYYDFYNNRRLHSFSPELSHSGIGGAQRIKVYYTKGSRGPATRADWENESERSVQVQLANGKILIINSGCQIVKII